VKISGASRGFDDARARLEEDALCGGTIASNMSAELGHRVRPRIGHARLPRAAAARMSGVSNGRRSPAA
jgi:hypothetical protein